MILLALDIGLSYILKVPTYFILINLINRRKDVWLILRMGLVLDLLILNTYFINTISLVIIFLIYKKFKIREMNLKNYLIVITFLFFSYNIFIGLFNGYSLDYLVIFVLKLYLINLPIYILSYIILKDKLKVYNS